MRVEIGCENVVARMRSDGVGWGANRYRRAPAAHIGEHEIGPNTSPSSGIESNANARLFPFAPRGEIGDVEAESGTLKLGRRSWEHKCRLRGRRNAKEPACGAGQREIEYCVAPVAVFEVDVVEANAPFSRLRNFLTFTSTFLTPPSIGRAHPQCTRTPRRPAPPTPSPPPPAALFARADPRVPWLEFGFELARDSERRSAAPRTGAATQSAKRRSSVVRSAVCGFEGGCGVHEGTGPGGGQHETKGNEMRRIRTEERRENAKGKGHVTRTHLQPRIQGRELFDVSSSSSSRSFSRLPVLLIFLFLLCPAAPAIAAGKFRVELRPTQQPRQKRSYAALCTDRKNTDSNNQICITLSRMQICIDPCMGDNK
ncbi:hypothetical protein C8R45DRAFT_1184329 [Mycena sanguinolenta]|nr:hypothetical protein C8R45DRAFT_1184329 [Mycena sanguinolenta]